jgi:L-amino acid N-acyltransferase YncA
MIRPARYADAPAIARVHVESWRETYAGLIPQHYLDTLDVATRSERWVRRIADKRSTHVFVAECEGRVVGFASGGPPQQPELGFDGELFTLYLLRSHQGRGLGRSLFESVAATLRGEGRREMYCWVLRGNDTEAFYRHLGGERRQSKTVELGAPLVEDLFLWRLSRFRAKA